LNSSTTTKVISLFALLIFTVLASLQLSTGKVSTGWWLVGSALLAFSGLVTIEVKDLQQLGDLKDKLERKTQEPDRSLFEEFLETLPSDEGSMFHLQEVQFAGGFRSEFLEDLQEFVYHWDNPEHEFKNENIEEERKQLLKSVKDFLDFTVINFGVNSSQGNYLVANWKQQPHSDQQKIKEHTDKCDELQDKVINHHQKLIRVAREELAV